MESYSDKYAEIKIQATLHNERNDCIVKAASMVFNLSYRDAHNLASTAGRRARCGSRGSLIMDWISDVTKIPVVKLPTPKQPNGSRYTIKTIANTFPIGTYLIYTSGHVLPLINGVVYDWSDGTKCRVIRVYRVGTDNILEAL